MSQCVVQKGVNADNVDCNKDVNGFCMDRMQWKSHVRHQDSTYFEMLSERSCHSSIDAHRIDYCVPLYTLNCSTNEKCINSGLSRTSKHVLVKKVLFLTCGRSNPNMTGLSN